MATGIFITGTDTDVGKTLVAAALYRAALMRSLPATAIKAVQSGCEQLSGGRLVAPDVELYKQAACGLNGGWTSVIYRFAPACSPHLAARLAGVEISIDTIVHAARESTASGRFTIIEGAGGLLVPLNRTETVLDLARAVAMPVLVVADNKLGAINHTLLSLQVLAEADLEVAGVVFNNCSPVTEQNRFIRQDNHQAIATFGRAPLIAGSDHFPVWNPHQGSFWDAVEAQLKKVTEHLLPTHEDID